MPLNIDLHCHSTASDGTLTPTELVRAACEADVSVLALTDHDTTAGLAEAHKAATLCGLQLINGTELSVRWQKRTLHIVGLGIDPADPSLTKGLEAQRKIREQRALEIASRLEKQGLENVMAKAGRLAGGSQMTRTHFARLLVDEGHCKDMKQAFRRYLGTGKPAHVTAHWVEMEEGINWIRQSGGVAVLAHPHLYNMSAAWRQRMFAAFSEAGGEAAEVCCGGSNAQVIETIGREVRGVGLMGSVGSDFHQPEQRWIRLGRLAPLPTGIPAIWNHERLTEKFRTAGAI